MPRKKRSKNPPVQPEWLLDNEYGLKRGPRSWDLMRKLPGAQKWKTRGFYNSVEAALKGYHRELLLSMPAEPNLQQHVSHGARTVAAAIDRLKDAPDSPLGRQ